MLLNLYQKYQKNDTIDTKMIRKELTHSKNFKKINFFKVFGVEDMIYNIQKREDFRLKKV